MQRIRDLWENDRGRLVHYLVASALAVFVFVELFAFDATSAVVVAAALTVAVALLFTRDAPFLAPLVVLAGFAVIVWDAGAEAEDLGSPFFVVVFFIPWSLGAYNSLRRAVVGLMAVEALGVWANVQFSDPSFSDFFFVALVMACSWAAGVFVGSRSEHAREMAERARRLELEHEEAAERAVDAERQRIARELHDVIAHSVSVMTVQAGAVRRLLRPEQENALKYGGTAHAWVSVHWLEDELELEVANDGKGDGDGSGGRHGLAGMRERVSLYGGTLDSGPRDGGGYVVRARLPVVQA
jgi:signal transduction histidine kinase